MSRMYLVNKSNNIYLLFLAKGNLSLASKGYVEVDTTDPSVMNYLTLFSQDLVLENTKPEFKKSDNMVEVENPTVNAETTAYNSNMSMLEATARVLEEQMKAKRDSNEETLRSMAQSMSDNAVEKKETINAMRVETAQAMADDAEKKLVTEAIKNAKVEVPVKKGK